MDKTMFNLSKTLLCFVTSGKEGRLQVYGPGLKYHRKYSLEQLQNKNHHLAGFLEGRVWKGGWGAEAELLMKQFYDSLKKSQPLSLSKLAFKGVDMEFSTRFLLGIPYMIKIYNKKLAKMSLH